MSYQWHVLLADNEDSVLRSIGRTLTNAGHFVLAARSVQQAKEILAEERVHAIVVDIRLEDDSDEDDVSGLELAAEVDGVVGKVITTGFDLSQRAIDRIWGSITSKINPGPLYVNKFDEPEKFVATVNRALREQVRISPDLGIFYSPGAEPEHLIDQIPALKDAPLSTRRRAAEELDDLLRKLFVGAQAVKVYAMTPGRGGSGVARVRPAYRTRKAKLEEGNFVAVKFGQRINFMREIENYDQHIERFFPRFATFLIGEAACTQQLGGGKFVFMGMPDEMPGDFQNFYLDPDVGPDAIVEVIRNIFETSWSIWYDHKDSWIEGEDADLSQSFGDQLFDDVEPWAELDGTLGKLLNDEPVHGISFGSPTASDQLEVVLNGKRQVLPNPVSFLKSKTSVLPRPRFVCVTHGDMTPRNIFVDRRRYAWLIDFYKTGLGPALRDVADLESSIKFQLVKTNKLGALCEFESAILAPTSFAEPISFSNPLRLPELDRALSAVRELRAQAYRIAEAEDMAEYYASLLFFAAKMITWHGISSLETKRRPIRQRHALYSAALLCRKFSPDQGQTTELIV
jgi:DNA-binding NarL/FixJ family response regulator